MVVFLVGKDRFGAANTANINILPQTPGPSGKSHYMSLSVEHRSQNEEHNYLF